MRNVSSTGPAKPFLGDGVNEIYWDYVLEPTTARTEFLPNPQAVTVYAKLLQAVNTGRWDGWVYSTIEGGQAFYRQASQKTFLTVRPKAGAQTPAGTRSWIWALVAIAAVIVVVTALLLRRRGRGRVEEAE